MTNKKTAKQEFVEKQRKEYTVKITTIIKTIVIVALLFVSFVAGWNSRSDFANEVRHEVRDQMSVQAQPVKQ